MTVRTRWILACALGEALGIAAVALAYAASGRGLVPPVPAILAAGAWEGLCLGTAQALVLSRAGLRPAAWIAVTVLLATLGYAGSLVAGAGTTPDPATPIAEPPLPLILAGGAAAGIVLGALMGAAQALASRRLVPLRAWVIRNAVGWALAMTAIFLGAALIAPGWPLAAVALTGLAAGAVAGAALGLATAPALPDPP